MLVTLLPAVPTHLVARGITLRPRQPEDGGFVRDLYVASRWDEVAATGWPEVVRLEFLHDQHRLQDAHYTRFYEGLAWGIIELNGEPVGRLYLINLGDDLRIADIALMPKYRGQGIGTGLLTEVQEMARRTGAAKASIHVEMNNPALRLYQRLGFRVAGTNGIYYLLEWTTGSGSTEHGLIPEVPLRQAADGNQK